MTKNKNLIFFLIITVISAVTMLIYAALTGNDNQTFTDVVIEYTSIYGSNKSAERSMFYIFAVLGAVAYAGLFWLGKCQTISIREKLVTPVGFALTALLVSVATNYVIYQKVYVVLLLALLLGVAALVKNKELAIPVLSLYFISMYGLIGLYRIYVLLGGTADANINYFAIPSMVLAVVLLLVSNDSKYIYRGMQILQLFVPFTLLMYLASAYKISDGQIINVDVPKRVLFVIGLIIACFIAEAAYKLKKRFKK